MATQVKRSTVLDQTRDAATALLAAYDKLIGLKNEWDNGLSGQIIDATGSDPAAPGYQANDFRGMEGLKKSDFNQVFNTAMVALTAFVVSSDGKKVQDIRK
jgi:hypothetical protein